MEVKLIYRNKLIGLGKHFGVYIPYTDEVFDYQQNQNMRRISLQEFACGKTVITEQVYEYNQSSYSRLLEYLRENRKYDLLSNNCEHFARDVLTGKKESYQVQGLAIMLFIFLGITLSSES